MNINTDIVFRLRTRGFLFCFIFNNRLNVRRLDFATFEESFLDENLSITDRKWGELFESITHTFSQPLTLEVFLDLPNFFRRAKLNSEGHSETVG